MSSKRLLAAAAAAALTAGTVHAQTSAAGETMTGSPTGSGAMTSPAVPAAPYAPPPTTGGPAASASGGGASGFTPITPVPGANIIATLKASGQFTRLLAGLDASNLTGLISTHPNLTLFAPTDAAFAQLPPGQLDMLMKSPAQLQALLAYHLVAAAIPASDIKGHAAGQVATAAKKPVTIDGSGPVIKVNEAVVLQPGVAASNGVIYPIDKVLTPAA